MKTKLIKNLIIKNLILVLSIALILPFSNEIVATENIEDQHTESLENTSEVIDDVSDENSILIEEEINEKTEEIQNDDHNDIIEENEEEFITPHIDVQEEKLIKEESNQTLNNSILTKEDLYGAIAQAQDGDLITLDENFIQTSLILEVTDVNIIIDANNILWNEGDFLLQGSKGGSITLKNIKINSENMLKYPININNSEGSVILDNVEIFKSNYGAILIDTPSHVKTSFNRLYIHDNKAYNQAPAIQLKEQSNLVLNHSTIENNSGEGSGVALGAISSTNYIGTLDINHSVFRNNVNKGYNSGVLGGGGGALSMFFFKGFITINNSIFDANQSSGADKSVNRTYDGGAIYILDGRDNATFTVNGSTFMNNIAYDDGGAMSIQGTGNPGLTTTISNSTFFNNKAYGLGDSDYAGGAIQFFKNGGSAKMTNNIYSSTFINNQGGNKNSKHVQRGGAIALSGAGIFAIPAVVRNDSLFLNNSVYGVNQSIDHTSNYRDLSNYTTEQTGTNNVINVDKGENPKYNPEMILGTSNIQLKDNLSTISAGYYPEIIQSIPIIPESIADNTYTGTAIIPTQDQRLYERYRDQGAVEMSWIKYDANGGQFHLEELTEYNGDYYYQKNNDENSEDYQKISKYYDISVIGTNTNVLSAQDLNLSRDGYIFKAWLNKKDNTIIEEDTILNFDQDNIILEAIWEEIPRYTITYNDGVEDEVIFEDQIYENIEEGSDTPVFLGELEREGYIFKGWSPELNETVSNDLTYVAQWTKVYTIRYTDGVDDEVIFEDRVYENIEEGSNTPLFSKDLIREGYVFVGWTPTLQETVYEDMIYVAQWEEAIDPTLPSNPSKPDLPEDNQNPINPESNQENSSSKTPSTGVFNMSHKYYFMILGSLLLLLVSVLSIKKCSQKYQ